MATTRKSKTDLVYYLGKPDFLNVLWEDEERWYDDWYDSEGKKIDPPKMKLIRSDKESALSRVLKYELDIYLINDKEYVQIHYANGRDGNDHIRSEDGYWSVEKVYSIDHNILMTAKNVDSLIYHLGNPTFVLGRDTDEDGYHWEDLNGNVIDPLDAELVRLDFSSKIARACGAGFSICNINGKEYVMLSMGWDEFGSGAYGFWPIEEVYAIDPNILDDEIVYRRSY